jgi:uncharacterized protein YndB with AHSA1/START domain
MMMTMQTALSADAPTIVFTRTFNAPRELVYAAWTDPKHVARWWGPHDFTTRAQIDLRVGGRFDFVMVAPDGELFPHGGEYLEIVPPERLVFTSVAGDRDWEEHGAPPNSVVTVTFEARGATTLMTVSSVLESFEERTALLKLGAKEGWAQQFEKLDVYLEEQRT